MDLFRRQPRLTLVLQSLFCPAAGSSRSFRVKFHSTFLVSLLACALTLAASTSFAQTSQAHHDVLIKNAIVMTATHGNITNGSIYLKDGKISAVGANVNAPAGATVIDAGGKYVTPGIVDAHSHIALDD